MSDHTRLPELTEEQVALANQGIEQFGAFLRDVVRQPEIVNEIPSGSTLAFYTLTLPDDWQPVRLTAFRPRRTKRWDVRVTDTGNLDDTLTYPRAMPDWLLSIVPLMQSASWESADEAFAAINEALQRATDLHLLAG
jgi:hypothetical protein